MESLNSIFFEGVSKENMDEIEAAAIRFGVHRRIGLCFLTKSMEEFLSDMDEKKADLLLETIELMGEYENHLVGMIEMVQKIAMRLACVVMYYADLEKKNFLLDRVDNLIENLVSKSCLEKKGDGHG